MDIMFPLWSPLQESHRRVVTGVAPCTNMKPEAKLAVRNQIALCECDRQMADPIKFFIPLSKAFWASLLKDVENVPSGVPGYEINITFIET